VFREPYLGIATMSHRLLVASILVTLWLTLTVPAMAQTPTPIAPPVLIDPLDPRAGESVNVVGAPLLAVVVVVASGALVAAGTIAYVKFSRGRGDER